MKKTALFVSLVFAASLAWSGAVAAEREGYGSTSGQSGQSQMGQEQQQQQQQQAGQQQSAEQKNIQAANDLKGFTIQNSQGEQLGEVSELLVDVEQGKIGYVVISSGGVLGVGGENYIVPFAALQFDQAQNALTLDMQKDQLRQAPEGDVAEALDREQGKEIHQYYGVSPYWEEAGAGQQPDQQQEQLQQQEQQEQLEQQQERPQQQERM